MRRFPRDWGVVDPSLPLRPAEDRVRDPDVGARPADLVEQPLEVPSRRITVQRKAGARGAEAAGRFGDEHHRPARTWSNEAERPAAACHRADGAAARLIDELPQGGTGWLQLLLTKSRIAASCPAAGGFAATERLSCRASRLSPERIAGEALAHHCSELDPEEEDVGQPPFDDLRVGGLPAHGAAEGAGELGEVESVVA
jgi:hypothetical protein